MGPRVGVEGEIVENLPLFPEGVPVQLRRKAVEELSLIIKRSVEIWPSSTGVLYGSLSYGEGKWRKVDGRIVMISDYDIYIILDGFLEYISALRKKDRIMELISKDISTPISLTFSLRPLIKYKMVSIPGKLIWGDKSLGSDIEKLSPPPLSNAIKMGYLYLLKAIRDKNKRRYFLESAVIYCFWSYLISRGSFKERWQDIFSLRSNIEVIRKDTDIDRHIKDVIWKTLEDRLYPDRNIRFYDNRDLMNAAKFMLDLSYREGNIPFRLKDYIHYISYKVRSRSIKRIAINFTKERLNLYKRMVDITDSDFNVSDMSELRDIIREAEDMLSVRKKERFSNSKEMVEYCSDLLVLLGDIYVHKVRR